MFVTLSDNKIAFARIICKRLHLTVITDRHNIRCPSCITVNGVRLTDPIGGPPRTVYCTALAIDYERLAVFLISYRHLRVNKTFLIPIRKNL